LRLRGGGDGRHNRGRGRMHVPDEIRATLVDHVLNQGLTMAEAGQMFGESVSSIIQAFR
jgi:transposase-like protein